MYITGKYIRSIHIYIDVNTLGVPVHCLSMPSARAVHLLVFVVVSVEGRLIVGGIFSLLV